MKFQERIHQDLYEYLRMEQIVDAMLPTCPDVEEKWTEIREEYLPDGVREFTNYPTAGVDPVPVCYKINSGHKKSGDKTPPHLSNYPISIM